MGAAATPILDLQKIQHFLAVYELRNFARAAGRAGVTQQAISKSIAKLEETLGVRLFERGAFGAEPTAYGKTLARRAKVILAEARLASAEISAIHGAADGLVRVGFGWSFLPRIAPRAIERFRRRRPGVTVSVTSGDSRTLYEKLLNGEIDVVASAPPGNFEIDPGLDATALFEDRDVVVFRRGHALDEKPIVSLAELADQTWLISLSLPEQWRELVSVFVAAGVDPPNKIIDIDSVLLAKALLYQTDSIALLARELVSTEVERNELSLLERADIPSVRTAYLVVRGKSPLTTAANAFVSDILHICRSIY